MKAVFGRGHRGLEVGDQLGRGRRGLEVGDQLGRGASAKVYLATHRPTNKTLALKVLENDLEASPERRRLLLNEVKLVYNARSDHLLTFYDAFLHEGRIYLALEYMDMGSVERLFEAAQRANARLPEEVIANLLVQILDGLTYLHKEQHAVHRELWPDGDELEWKCKRPM